MKKLIGSVYNYFITNMFSDLSQYKRQFFFTLEKL